MSRLPSTFVILCSLVGWLMASTPLNSTHTVTAEPGKDLKCVSLDGLTIEELEREMTTLVFSSRSTVVTGNANLKSNNGTAVVGYACGW